MDTMMCAMHMRMAQEEMLLNHSPSSGWTPLAHGEIEGDEISRCSGGHIHLDYGNFSIRFERDEFLAFTRMVVEAATRLTGAAPITPFESSPSTPISLN